MNQKKRPIVCLLCFLKDFISCPSLLPHITTLQPQRPPQQPPQTQPQTQGSVSAPLYNTMMISQPGQPNMLQISAGLPPTNPQPGTAVATFTQDRQIRYVQRVAQYFSSCLYRFLFLFCNSLSLTLSCPLFLHVAPSRFPAGQQLVTKLVTAPMACGAVMVPTSMFMGQVVTAYNPFGGQQVRTKLHESRPMKLHLIPEKRLCKESVQL